MRKARVTQRDILFLSLSMFIMVTIWVGFNLYHAWVTSKISDDLQIQITPIDPNFDTDTIHALKNRETVIPLFKTLLAPEASTSAPISTPPPPSTPASSTSADTTILTPSPSISPTSKPTPTL